MPHCIGINERTERKHPFQPLTHVIHPTQFTQNTHKFIRLFSAKPHFRSFEHNVTFLKIAHAYNRVATSSLHVAR